MQSRKKLVWEVLFLLVVFAGTIYGVFHGEDIGESIEIIKNVNDIYLLPAVACVVFFIWGESIIIHYMMLTLNYHIKKWTCFLFSSVGFFFSCITPSASGGQPAQIYYMRRKSIPIPVSTLVLMVVTITYKAVLVLIGLTLVLFGQGFIHRYLMDILPIFYLGIVLNVGCVAIMLILVFDPSLARRLINGGLSLLEKTRLVRYRISIHKRLERAMTKYSESAEFFKRNKKVVFKVLLITFAQRTALFLSTYFVYRAFGLEEFSVFTIVMLQAVISVSVDMLPLPGGMGISETLFLTIFVPAFGAKMILPAMILSRGLSYYTELLLSAALTIVAHFTIKTDLGENYLTKNEKI